MSSLSTSQTFSDDLADYDVISENGSRSLESSIADLNAYDPSEELEFPSDPSSRNDGPQTVPSTAQNTVRGRDRDPTSNPLNFRVSPRRGNWEPDPLQPAKDRFETARLTADQIQDYVRKSLEESHSLPPTYGHGQVLVEKMGTVRVYVDGLFDGLNVALVLSLLPATTRLHTFVHSQSLRLRQAKLSFPQAHLIVGVFPDAERGQHNLLPLRPHVERCEIVRHCRWVDEVVPDAPWALDEEYLQRHKVDYVAVEEGSTGRSNPFRTCTHPTNQHHPQLTLPGTNPD
jgi:glycerol-3-phosphate cytidylyltransferase-like family protein